MEQQQQSSNSSGVGVKIGIFILVVVLVGGFYFYKNYAVKNQPSTQITDEADLGEDNEEVAEQPPLPTLRPSNTPTPTAAVMSVYKDGSYSAMGQYISPGGQEEVGVTLTIAKDIVTKAVFEPKATRPASVNFQGQFAAGFESQVIGKNLKDLSLTKVSGSSLTPKGFNDAVAKIRLEAKS